MPSVQRDYYEILSVEKTADGEEIKRAYRRMAMKYHPDRNPGDGDAEIRFKECAEAYEVLSDDGKRKVYDQFGHEGLKRGGGQATHDFTRMNVEDIFSMFNDIFGGGGAGGRRGGGPARGYDLETEVSISLEQVLSGSEQSVEFTRMDICEKCGGSGAKPGTKPMKCPTCEGHGKVQQSGMGGMFRMVVACPACNGRGQVVKEFCDGCRGKGRVPKKRKIGVRIPAGIHDGQAVRVRGEGEPPPPEAMMGMAGGGGEGLRGDLHVVVRVREHERLKREGNHLVMPMPVSFAQAALGADVQIATLDGTHTVTISRGTQHGALFRVDAAGLPDLRTGQRGDLVVVATIDIPKKLTTEQEKHLRDYAATENLHVAPPKKGFFDSVRESFRGKA